MTSSARFAPPNLGVQAFWSSVASGAVAAVRESRLYLGAVGLQLATSALFCYIAHLPMLAGPWEAYSTVVAAVGVFGFLVLAVEIFRRRRRLPRNVSAFDAYRRALADLRGEALTADYVATVLLTILVAPLALSAFSAAKQAIPVLHPFNLDPQVATWGQWLDGGTPMWRRLQPALGRPAITVAIDGFYHRVWPAVLLGAFVFGTLMKGSPLRRQFLLAFALVWLVEGNLIALAFASAGPAYFAHVAPGAADQYQPLLDYLRSVDLRFHLLSFRGEGFLWYAYAHELHGFGYGVSAMPSVHVASAALIALFGFRLSRLLGAILALLAVATFFGSIALGWHYAIDGYVGIAVAAVLWWGSGRLAGGASPRLSARQASLGIRQV